MTNPSPDSSSSRFSRFMHRLRHDRGAVLVETAIALPLLLLVILGAVESGLAWEAKSATISGVRTGVLRASTEAANPGADIRVIQSIIGEIGADDVDNINSIMIFEAGGSTAEADAKFEACRTGTSSGSCVIYNPGFIQDVAVVNVANTAQMDALLTQLDNGGGVVEPDGTYTCDTGQLDTLWCSGRRATGRDSTLAVAIDYKHPWLTGIFPFDDPTFTEYVVSSTFINDGADVTSNP